MRRSTRRASSDSCPVETSPEPRPLEAADPDLSIFVLSVEGVVSPWTHAFGLNFAVPAAPGMNFIETPHRCPNRVPRVIRHLERTALPPARVVEVRDNLALRREV